MVEMQIPLIRLAIFPEHDHLNHFHNSSYFRAAQPGSEVGRAATRVVRNGKQPEKRIQAQYLALLCQPQKTSEGRRLTGSSYIAGAGRKKIYSSGTSWMFP